VRNATSISPSLEDYLEAVLEVADEAGAARTTDVSRQAWRIKSQR